MYELCVYFLVVRNGNIRARHIKLVKCALPERFQGVVCSMKDNYGFIERSDIVKEIFFHYSEFQGNVNELLLGDDVEFAIQTRNVSTCIRYSHKELFSAGCLS